MTRKTAQNIEQRVFDALPAFPGAVTVYEIYNRVPLLRESIQEALKRLRERAVVEFAPGTRYTYRRVEGATRPPDRRAGNANKRGRGHKQRRASA